MLWGTDAHLFWGQDGGTDKALTVEKQKAEMERDDILYKANVVFKRAVDAIIHFGTEQHKSFFAPSEAVDIKRDAGILGNDRAEERGRHMAL